jgi:tetratricopeptide (TPR) repeat protein
MTESWDARVHEFWSQADDSDPNAVLAAMGSLIEERPPGDAAALYEWGSALDFLGREAEAIPLYRQALEAGLDNERRPQALIQLASSLRNAGEPGAAIEILEQMQASPITGDAHRAFLAMALFDAGRREDALRIALEALAKTLPLYGRAVAAYVHNLHSESPEKSA